MKENILTGEVVVVAINLIRQESGTKRVTINISFD